MRTPGQRPTESGWVKLDTNESGYPPSPRVAEAIQRELAEGGARLRLYPERRLARRCARRSPPIAVTV
jgi:histidinol-phosphate aminotransferase